jgi:type II secretion system protein N
VWVPQILKSTMLLPRARRYRARTRARLLRWVGLAALALCTFIIAVQVAFPYSRLVDRAAAGLSARYGARVDRLERGLLPGRFSLHGVHLVTRAVPPLEVTFERVDVALSLPALMAGRIESEVDARGASGRLRGRVDEAVDGVVVDLEATELRLARFAGGSPIAGDPAIRMRLRLPGGALSAARGQVDVACEDCAIESSPPVRLGRVDGRARVEGGVVCIADLRARSGDGAFRLEGGLRLADDLAGTRVDLVASAAPAARERGAGSAVRAEDAARAAAGRIGALEWSALPAPAGSGRAGGAGASHDGRDGASRCARLRAPEPPAVPSPPPTRVAAAPSALPSEPSEPSAPSAPPASEPAPPASEPAGPAPAALEPEVPVFDPASTAAPADRGQQKPAEIIVDY